MSTAESAPRVAPRPHRGVVIPAAIAGRAARGAAALDAARPGWAASINLKTLRLAECPGCILGQLFGRYIDGRDALDPARRVGWAAHHGFYAHSRAHYSLLRRAWAAEVEARTRDGDTPTEIPHA